MIRYLKLITYFGKPCVLACDGRCEKAWGMNNRPQEQLSEDIDDYVYKPDSQLGKAPEDPGTYEGDHAKPTSPEEVLNKWCARECERSVLKSDRNVLIELPDLERPLPNFGSRHEEWKRKDPVCTACHHPLRHHNSHGHDSGGCTLGSCTCLDYVAPR